MDNNVVITILRDRLTYKAGTKIIFNQNDFNIVVGDNGSGKSTLIDMLNGSQMKHFIDNEYISVNNLKAQKGRKNIAEGFRSRQSQFVDNEKELYLTKLNQLSHGEAWKKELEKTKERVAPDGFIIMDEPETALSTEAQIDLCEWFINYKIKNPEFGCLIATHSLTILELLAEHVIEVPSGRHLPIEPYLAEKRAKVEARKERIDKLKDFWNQSKNNIVIQ